MITRTLLRILPLIAITCITQTMIATAGTIPDTRWMRYTNVEQAGWSQDRLDAARAYADSVGSAAVMVVQHGVVVAAWGDVVRRFQCNSIRKSLLSALIGIHVDSGEIDTAATLADLGIDDIAPSLSAAERRARVVDLLTSRSGVYHAAAYENASKDASRPARGSHAPGTYFWYNNWDFNALLTVVEQQTGTKVFDEFDRAIAGPIGMQDYSPSNGHYYYERDKSMHPAYPLRMSTRDLARFGLLYLRRGRWGDRRVVPADWVDESTRPHADAGAHGSYGYMWWRLGPDYADHPTIAAFGTGNQVLAIIPSLDLVFVHRADTYHYRPVSMREVAHLLRMVIAAEVDTAATDRDVVALAPVHREPAAGARTGEQLDSIAGTYRYADGHVVTIAIDGDQPMMDSNPFGYFALTPLGDGSYWIEDFEARAWFDFDDRGRRSLVVERFVNDAGYALMKRGEFDQAVEVLKANTRHYPGSANAFDSLGEALFRAGRYDEALASYRQSLHLDPGSRNAARMIEHLEHRVRR